MFSQCREIEEFGALGQRQLVARLEDIEHLYFRRELSALGRLVKSVSEAGGALIEAVAALGLAVERLLDLESSEIFPCIRSATEDSEFEADLVEDWTGRRTMVLAALESLRGLFVGLTAAWTADEQLVRRLAQLDRRLRCHLEVLHSRLGARSSD